MARNSFNGNWYSTAQNLSLIEDETKSDIQSFFWVRDYNSVKELNLVVAPNQGNVKEMYEVVQYLLLIPTFIWNNQNQLGLERDFLKGMLE